MIEISLVDKSDSLTVDAHPSYLDFKFRDSRSWIEEARVEIADENLVAPIVKRIAGMMAIETYPELEKAKLEIAEAFPRREDGARLVELLSSWTRRWPAARWQCTGAEAVPAGRYLAIATQPRFSSRSLTADPFAKDGPNFIGDGERMDDLAGVDLELLERELTGPALLRREISSKSHSSGSKGRVRKDRRPSYAARRMEDGFSGAEVTQILTVRLSGEKRAALKESGHEKELIGTLADLLASGVTVEAIQAALESSSS